MIFHIERMSLCVLADYLFGFFTREAQEKPGKCKYPLLPLYAAFIEIMAPVFSRDAWRCVWHMIQVPICSLFLT